MAYASSTGAWNFSSRAWKVAEASGDEQLLMNRMFGSGDGAGCRSSIWWIVGTNSFNIMQIS